MDTNWAGFTSVDGQIGLILQGKCVYLSDSKQLKSRYEKHPIFDARNGPEGHFLQLLLANYITRQLSSGDLARPTGKHDYTHAFLRVRSFCLGSL